MNKIWSELKFSSHLKLIILLISHLKIITIIIILIYISWEKMGNPNEYKRGKATRVLLTHQWRQNCTWGIPFLTIATADCHHCKPELPCSGISLSRFIWLGYIYILIMRKVRTDPEFYPKLSSLLWGRCFINFCTIFCNVLLGII